MLNVGFYASPCLSKIVLPDFSDITWIVSVETPIYLVELFLSYRRSLTSQCLNCDEPAVLMSKIVLIWRERTVNQTFEQPLGYKWVLSVPQHASEILHKN